MPECTKCKTDKSIDEFYPRKDGRKGYHSRCKKCEKAKRNKCIKDRKKRMGYKKQALDIYGNRCQSCGLTNLLCLQFHHRIPNIHPSDKVYNYITKNGRDKNIQLFCANHHILADIKDKTKELLDVRGV